MRSSGRSRSRMTRPGHRHWFEPIAEHLGVGVPAVLVHQGHGAGGRLRRRRARVCSRATECSTSAAGPGVTPTSWPGGEWWCTASTSAGGSSTWPAERRPAGSDVRAPRRPPPAVRRASSTPSICLCQGAFGLMTAERRRTRSCWPGSPRAATRRRSWRSVAFNAYFAVKYHEAATFDAATGVSHERTEVRDEDGRARRSTCGPGATRRASCACCARTAGLDVDRSAGSVEPGEYGEMPPSDRDRLNSW